MIDYGVTFRLSSLSNQPKVNVIDFKITLWKELGHLVQRHRIAIKNTFFLRSCFMLICCQTLLQIIFQVGEYDQ